MLNGHEDVPFDGGGREQQHRLKLSLMRKLGMSNFGPQSFQPPPVQQTEAPDRLETQKEAEPEEECDIEMEMDTVDIFKPRDDFRVSYLKKLSYNQVWVPNSRRPPKHQTVIIFDWDDTLLPTSFLNLRWRGDDQLPSTLQRQLTLIEKTGSELLNLACRLSGSDHVFIITNAMQGWVEYSAKKYIAGILPALDQVTIISARRQFESRFPGQYHEWKTQAFLEVQRQLNSQVITNLISLGDSNFEMDAVHVMGKEFAQALVKTIKFRDNPSPDELAKQLELVLQKFEKICMNARNLKIGLERKWVHPAKAKAPQAAAGGGEGSKDASASSASAASSPPATTNANASSSPLHGPGAAHPASPTQAGAGGGSSTSQIGNLGIQQAFAAQHGVSGSGGGSSSTPNGTSGGPPG
uniref:Uncharacterized protein n=1 Tax=Chromera velia CCMP2878 TaxID=1169474 RepID=A0A0G4HH21_9ALVE|eukprot:Cvel_27493.t1-p1 / transcript=Cvel_27493.t1 / gene=Cvel_27493 / organism=Chromera_velia_CCMP2878 / gene_product=hypothetical protein / transcript_product=hypothetical protein / location=Cvel_scaffold3438:1363-2589(+) / protein_length=409 / sequence_SO=supercontig / SO=protein_coding / is_pseudo=false